jgi:serine/threonine-protein kinase RsbT
MDADAEGTAIAVRDEADVLGARQLARSLGNELGFSQTELTLIATAISEIARNMLIYARGGELELLRVEDSGRRGMSIVARDRGPGIPDITSAMRDGYTTGHGLGLGLPGAKRLMDEFDIQSTVGVGTTVCMTKWVP